ncbi:probable E3 ubiquitin-protein ligase HERC6 [Suncus etruscus]|uniref:probable E3 ubiquitin-protein ligase HERC6 n=1 Tax=Suncus etruscus TaxID=109475 RepID=UPI002110B8FB|nr:probable E3 ubiquitin-protein ligase HERC6 [Suncus etruscus]
MPRETVARPRTESRSPACGTSGWTRQPSPAGSQCARGPGREGGAGAPRGGHAHRLESSPWAHCAKGLGAMSGRGADGRSRSRGRRGRGSGSRSRRRSGSGGSGGGPSWCWCWRAGGSGPERWAPEGAGRAEPVLAASGARHSLLLLGSGSVLSCGDNSRGQLGRLGAGASERPVPIRAVESLRFTFVSCGKEYSLALCHRGMVFAWGAGTEGQLGIGEFKERVDTPMKIKSLSGIKIIQISCGDHHSLALSEDSQLFSWGSNSHGQLGLGKEFSSQKIPKQVKSLYGIPLAQVAAGGNHSFALSLAGTSFGWGSNNVGQLALSGRNVPVESSKPRAVGALQKLGVVYISCGQEHTAVLTQDGKVFTFGDNTYRQLGHSFAKSGPHPVEGILGLVSQIDCGSKHTLVYVYTTGQVLSFGCGPSLTSNSTHSEAVENLNINCLIPVDDLLNVQVKHIFAGTYANFVTTYQPTSPSIPKKTLPEISRICQSLTEKWISKARSGKHRQVESEIETIFSSPACLTASFLQKREPEETVFVGVDLQMARDTFKMLTENKRISSMITTHFSEKLFRDLPYGSRHEEALLVFLLLPECPVMHESSNWKNLIVPFAEAVGKMSSLILEQWWGSLQGSYLNTLVKMLKTAMISLLDYGFKSLEHHCNAKVLLEMMKKVYKVNSKVDCRLPDSTFYINEFSDSVDFLEDRHVAFCKDNGLFQENNSPVIFSDYPFIFNLVSKIKSWRAYSFVRKKEVGVKKNSLWIFLGGECFENFYFVLNVGRSHLVEDTLRHLNYAEVTDLQKELLVGFIGEIRPKCGAVVSEFFHAVFEEMTEAKYRLFTYPEEGSYMWFPANPVIEKKRYYLFGLLCGLSLYNDNVANIPFPLALFKKLLGQKPSLEDLKELSPLRGKNLQEILNYEADNIEDLSIYFTIYWDQNDVSLISNGSSILVDHTNKEDFVSECINYIFNTSIDVVYMEFQRGFYSVCDEKLIRQLFQPEELMEAVIGNTVYDWEEFEKNSTYGGGYSSSHPTIKMFWKVFHKLTLEEKKKFLLFLTGNDRLQVKGMMKTGINFRYSETLRESDNLRSLICHNLLDLPKYSTKKRMKEALQIAINNSTGFDVALATL